MDDWQKELIRKNLSGLVENTICSTGLLTKLEECGILGSEDVEEIKLSGTTQLQQARTLYKIIITRANSLQNLLEALEQTKQSGVVAILTSKIKTDDIQIISYDVNTVLGEGSYGTVVYKGKFWDRDVAVKMVHSNLLGGAQRAFDEVKLLKDCDSHENVVRYFGSQENEGSILIVLELCDMSLNKWVENKLTDISPVEILRQMTAGLEWLHSHNIVHRDLKPENVLILRNVKRVKLSDFGVSRRIMVGNSFVATSTVGGTPGWMAPELLEYVVQGKPTECKFTYASDVFALGRIYYYVLTDGKFLFGDVVRCQANILDDKSLIVPTDINHGCTQNVLFIKKMISRNMKSRPSCTELLSYPIFWTQSERIIFLNQFKSTVYATAQKVIRFGPKDPCRFDHTDELNVLTNLSSKLNPAIACVLPVTYMKIRKQYKNTISASDLPAYANNSSSSLLPNISSGNDSANKQSNETFRNITQLFKNLEANTIIPNDSTSNRNSVHPILPTTIAASSEGGKNTQNGSILPSSSLDEVKLRPNDSTKGILKAPLQQKEVITILNDLKKLDLKGKHTKLLEVVRYEDLSVIKGVFDGAGHINPTEIFNNQNKTLLHVAVAFRKYEVVEYLMTAQGFNESLAEPIFKDTLIHDCIKKIHEVDVNMFEEKCRILKLLFQQHPHFIDSKIGVHQRTPLHIATANVFKNGKQLDFLNMLFRYNPQVNLQDKYGNTPLHLAVRNVEEKWDSFEEVLKLFQFHGADFNVVSSDTGDSIIFSAIQRGESEKVLKLLIEHGADWKIKNNYNGTALHQAAFFQNLDALKLFLSLARDVNARDEDGCTALHSASTSLQSNANIAHEIVSELLKNGADASLSDKDGYYPIDFGTVSVVEGRWEQRTFDILEESFAKDAVDCFQFLDGFGSNERIDDGV
ncbi:unnamed protein product [Orchesella dallaii]|uniref:Uncharacterized protein n=1 Tax=Orchesella dallaii TaxID=48710 RepID=A0ABP1PQL4_9HEXA